MAILGAAKTLRWPSICFPRCSRFIEFSPSGRFTGLGYSSGVKGHVRIQANASAPIEYLPLSLTQFKQAFPEVRIDLEERPSAEIVRSVREGNADIGIYAGHVDDHLLKP